MVDGPDSDSTINAAVSIADTTPRTAETMSRHPELFHYTKPEAFEGIVGSQTLWCSYYREMLDTVAMHASANFPLSQ
jgi:hypothetical protein